MRVYTSQNGIPGAPPTRGCQSAPKLLVDDAFHLVILGERFIIMEVGCSTSQSGD